MEKAKVYFIKEISEDNLVRIYDVVGKKLEGKVAVKVHSGEAGNQNYLRPLFMKKIIDYVSGVVVECNTAYTGERDTTEKHLRLLEDHEWSKYFEVDLLDAYKDDIVLNIENGRVIHKNYVGGNIVNYDSLLVLSHFKGHPMGGYGGALKQLSIGLASSKGKRYIHCAGKENGSYEDMFKVEQDKFLEAMADAASSIIDYFKNNIVYINVMCNMSVDCDCCSTAEAPCLEDIGILASTDPVALDMACIDLVKESNDLGKAKFLERVNSRNGLHTLDIAEELEIGVKEYQLIEIE